MLISKVDYPKCMKNLRPIFLCDVVYKILTKAIANGLREVIDKCVSKEHPLLCLVDQSLIM